MSKVPFVGGRAADAPLTEELYDIAVVGAGIVGLAVAREILLRRPTFRVVIFDREDSVAAHQTGHNSGVIHSGIYYTPGSLKARLCVEGSRLMYAYCVEHEIAHERCGKLIVATTESELPQLDALEARGRANGVPGLRRVSAEEIVQIEPECRGVSALYSPNTGIVDYRAVARSLEAELRSLGAEFKLGCRVSALRRRDGTTVLTHDDGETGARWAIACAGLWSDRLAEDAGAPADPRIIPFRGAYLRLQRDQPPVVRGLVYPVPDPALPFLGVHITKQINGDVLLGPTAMVVGAKDAYKIRTMRLRDLASTFLWPGTWRVGGRFWKTALNEIHMAVSRKDFVRACSVYLPALRRMKLEPVGQAGVRAQAVARDGTLVDDFVISETPGATHLRNAPSPAATSSLALAREVVDRLEKNLS
jgi:L-2-hydroxyglutarate oxidase